MDHRDALRAELMRAATRQVNGRQRRRRIVRGGVMAALTGLVVGSTVLGGTPDRAEADVTIRYSRERVTVTLEDLEHRPGVIEGAIREAGLDVSVRAVPVGPSRVGRFVGTVQAGSAPGEIRAVGSRPGDYLGFSVPRNWDGSLELLVGRPAKAGEMYFTVSDATQPGESLACSDVVGRLATRAEELADAADLVRSYEVTEGDPPQTRVLQWRNVRENSLAGWYVLSALGLDSGSVRFVLVPDPPAADSAASAC